MTEPERVERRYQPSELRPAVYKAAEVARLMGLEISAFNRRVRDGEFPVPPLAGGGHRLWSKARVDAYLAGEDVLAVRSEGSAA